MRFFLRWPLSSLTMVGVLCFAAGFYCSPPVVVIMVEPQSSLPIISSPEILSDRSGQSFGTGDPQIEFLIIPVDPWTIPAKESLEIGPVLWTPLRPEDLQEI